MDPLNEKFDITIEYCDREWQAKAIGQVSKTSIRAYAATDKRVRKRIRKYIDQWRKEERIRLSSLSKEVY